MPTIEGLLAKARSRLTHCSDSPLLDAEILLSHLLKKNRSYLLTWPEKSVSPSIQNEFYQLLARRQNKEPVAYLIGRWSFWDLDLMVTPDTLIPRPETELLVETALKFLAANPAPKILDLGTGSGAIALAIASECPAAKVLATDQSKAALNIAQQNAKDLNLSNIGFKQGCWFKAVTGLRFDIIISNPPYIAEDDPHLNALKHEPHSALSSGKQGLDDIVHLVQHAAKYLLPKGLFIFEHGFDQGAASRNLLTAAGFKNVTTLHDYAGHERISYGRL